MPFELPGLVRSGSSRSRPNAEQSWLADIRQARFLGKFPEHRRSRILAGLDGPFRQLRPRAWMVKDQQFGPLALAADHTGARLLNDSHTASCSVLVEPWDERDLPNVAVALERSALHAPSELLDVASGYVVKANVELRAKFGEVPQDVSKFESQRVAVGLSHDSVVVTKDLFDLASDLPGLVHKAERGVDDRVIHRNDQARYVGITLIGGEVERGGV